MKQPLPVLGDNTTLRNMDGVIGYSYTGLGNGEVVVIFGGSVREYRNILLYGGNGGYSGDIVGEM